MFTFEVSPSTFKDIRAVQRSARSAKTALSDRRIPLEKIKRKQLRRWDENFNNQGTLYGKWAALEPTTLTDRRNRGYGDGPILVRSGALSNWVTTRNRAGTVAAQSLRWSFTGRSGGAGGASAPFHSSGFYNVAAGRYVAPRVIWDLNQEDQDNAQRELDKYVDTIIKKYFS